MYDATRATLAANLRLHRKALGLSQKALALDAEVNRTFVSQIEREIGNPSLQTMCKLAQRLSVPCHVLLTPLPEP